MPVSVDSGRGKGRAIPWTLWKKPVHNAFELSNFAVEEHQQSAVEEHQQQVYDVGFYRNTENIDDDLDMEETLAALDDKNSLGEVKGYTDQGLDIGDTGMETGVDLSVVEDKSCHAEVHADYYAASVIKWGPQNIVESAADCCNSCTVEPSCNIWVFCPDLKGCGDQKFGTCWLKKTTSIVNILGAQGTGDKSNKWISGAIYAEEDKEKVINDDAERLKLLQEDTGEIPQP
eukprot:gene21990-29048_t